MSPKARFQLMLEPEQLAELRQIEANTDVPVSRQIRRAIDLWLEQQGDSVKAQGKRPAGRKPR
jgi:hypothetical protein